MKRLLALIICILAILTLSGCGGEKMADDGKISIVATAFPHYDFARQITKGVENVEIKMLISPGSEVHSYEPTPSDILAISECDLFIYTGGESDTWVKGILESSGNENMKIVSFMDLCKDSIQAHEKEHEGHEHVYDEHVWTSPAISAYLVHAIKNILIGIDGDNADIYTKNADGFEKEIVNLENAISRVMDSRIRNTIIVADRFPFYHLSEAFEIEYLAAYPGCSHSTEPSASVIAELSEKVNKENIPYVFTIEFSNQKIAKSVIEGTDAEILTLHSCHNVSKEDFDGGITYIDLMRQNTANLRKALCE